MNECFEGPYDGRTIPDHAGLVWDFPIPVVYDMNPFLHSIRLIDERYVYRYMRRTDSLGRVEYWYVGKVET